MCKLLRKLFGGPKKPWKTDGWKPLEAAEKEKAGKIPYDYD